MQFTIAHSTEYTYSESIYLQPQQIRLMPRSDPHQTLKSFQISIDPAPTGMTQMLDAESQPMIAAWFVGSTDKLTISTQAMVETHLKNPFSYHISIEDDQLPMTFTEPLQTLFLPAMQRQQIANADPIVEFAEQMKERAEGRLLAFLHLLNTYLSNEFEVIRRDHGQPLTPAMTWMCRSGACRDLSVLFMDVCRCVGIPSRFVSGYQATDDDNPADLHAWVEVYIPGGGWRGYDPTAGLAVAEHHVALASSVYPECAAPVTGKYHGQAESSIQANIQIAAC